MTVPLAHASVTASRRDSFAMDDGSPEFRATIRRDGAVRLVDWGPWLAVGGPLHTLLDARGRAGVGIADLTVLRDEDGVAVEVIIEFRCGGSVEHREAITDWAARIGYRRAWFEGEVAELDPAPGGRAETRCTGCRARLVDAAPSFWDFVRRRGAFPSACVLCGSDLPQWTGGRQTAGRTGDPDPSENARRSRCK